MFDKNLEEEDKIVNYGYETRSERGELLMNYISILDLCVYVIISYRHLNNLLCFSSLIKFKLRYVYVSMSTSTKTSAFYEIMS